jgi:hypothetical protein
VIKIQRTNETDPGRAWRATVLLTRSIDWAVVGCGVQGQLTDTGPWVEGFGHTPDGAMDAAMIAIGKAVTHMTEPGRERARTGT